MSTKTLKQIADELGVNKQQVYRLVRKYRISEAHQEGDTRFYDEAAETLIKSHFSDKAASREAHREAHQTASTDTATKAAFDALSAQLDVKDKQIAALTAALEHTTASLHAAQALHAATVQQQLTDGSGGDDAAEPDKPSGLFGRIFGRKKP